MNHIESSNKECIASIPLFDALSSCDIDTIASFCNIRTYRQGDVLFYEKDNKDPIYYIISGSIKFYKVDRFDNEIFLYIRSSRFVSAKIYCLQKAQDIL